jgi:hypothetical protein
MLIAPELREILDALAERLNCRNDPWKREDVMVLALSLGLDAIQLSLSTLHGVLGDTLGRHAFARWARDDHPDPWWSYGPAFFMLRRFTKEMNLDVRHVWKQELKSPRTPEDAARAASYFQIHELLGLIDGLARLADKDPELRFRASVNDGENGRMTVRIEVTKKEDTNHDG